MKRAGLLGLCVLQLTLSAPAVAQDGESAGDASSPRVADSAPVDAPPSAEAESVDEPTSPTGAARGGTGPGADASSTEASAPDASTDESTSGAPRTDVPAPDASSTDGSSSGEAAAALPSEPAATLHPPGELEMFEEHVASNIRYRPGSGLAIRSDDGEFGLTTRVRVQIRGTLDNEPGTEWRQELTLRRARLAFSGNFFGADNRFKLELALSPRDQGIGAVFDSDGPERTPLLDYYIEFRQLRDLNLRVGQYKVPFSRQRVISSGDLQMVDRSIVNSGFNLDRDVGLDIRSRDLFGLGMFRYALGVYIGQGRDAVGADDFGLMYIGRVEFLPFGMFDDYREADHARSLTPRLSIGVAGAAVDRAHGERGILGRAPADGGTTNTQHFTADAVFMYGGLSLFTEFALRTGQRNPGDATDEMGAPIPVSAPLDGWGVMGQVGYLLPNLPIEIAARYGTRQPMNQASALSAQNELGLALSYYIGRHPFKVQLDAFQLWGDAFETGTTRIRLQLQASL